MLLSGVCCTALFERLSYVTATNIITQAISRPENRDGGEIDLAPQARDGAGDRSFDFLIGQVIILLTIWLLFVLYPKTIAHPYKLSDKARKEVPRRYQVLTRNISFYTRTNSRRGGENNHETLQTL